ncbi:17613_t:CDS:2 [Gigaspora rosea]|nr:17613_t:CDS:2 [Gigaspora rosea]
MQKIIHKLAKVLILQYKTISIRNEASKSHYISSYLVVASNFFKNRFTICSEKAISDPNGHRLLDYPLVTSTSSKVIGAIEVKATDYLQGIAQNTVQCESILTNRRKLFSESLLILRNSFFLKCFSNNNGSPIFQLSKQLVVVYRDDNMEARVGKRTSTFS